MPKNKLGQSIFYIVILVYVLLNLDSTSTYILQHLRRFGRSFLYSL